MLLGMIWRYFVYYSDKGFGDVLAVDVVPEAIRHGIKIVA